MKTIVTIRSRREPIRTIEVSLEDYVTFIGEQAIQLGLVTKPQYELVGFDEAEAGKDFTSCYTEENNIGGIKNDN